ncbi:MAG: hypothetical protein AAF335_05125, partial [Bacteroidota bacterium]
MTSLPTWSLFLLLMTGTCHQLCAEKEEETYEQIEEEKGSKIKKYLKPQYLIVTLLAIVGSSFVYFQYKDGKEGDKSSKKPTKDSKEDELNGFMDASDVGHQAKQKKLNKKIKDKDVTAEKLSDLPTQGLIDPPEPVNKYAPILKEGKQRLTKEEQESHRIEERDNLFLPTETKEDVAKLKSPPLPMVAPNSGLIGLQNFNDDEANICYLNAAVQLLLQNPPLVKALRERQYFKKNKYVTKKEDDPEQDMWACFVELAQEAIQPPNAKQASFNTTYIATQLRKNDEQFKKDEMYDAFNTFDSMAEILDENFLKRMGFNIKVNEDSWKTIGLKRADLEKKITEFYEAYNPKHVSSPIRKMHFILEESFEAVGLPEKHKHAEKQYGANSNIQLPWLDSRMEIKVDFYENNKKKNETFKLNLKKTSSVRSLQYMIFDQLIGKNTGYKDYTAEDIEIGYVDITEEDSKTGYVDIRDIRYVTEKFTIKQLLEKKRYIFAKLATQKQPKVATIQVNHTAINKPKKPAITTTLEERIKTYLEDVVSDEFYKVYKKKYDKNSNLLVEDKRNEVPVVRVRKKIVKYPEVLILFTDRETDNEYDFKKYPVDFEEKMTLD